MKPTFMLNYEISDAKTKDREAQNKAVKQALQTLVAESVCDDKFTVSLF